MNLTMPSRYLITYHCIDHRMSGGESPGPTFGARGSLGKDCTALAKASLHIPSEKDAKAEVLLEVIRIIP